MLCLFNFVSFFVITTKPVIETNVLVHNLNKGFVFAAVRLCLIDFM